jgi:hypothetical protein
MAASSTEAELTRQAAFVFKGTVQKLKAATMTTVPVTARTAIVRVDEIIQAPKLLMGYVGKAITLQLEPGHKVKEGAAALFYTNNLLFGEGIAAQAIGHTDLGPVNTASAARSAAERSPVETTETRELQAHLADADMIVTGKVLSVSLASEPAGRASRGADASTTTTSRMSEHSARWREAVVAVSQVDKGQPTVKQLVVRFPGSDDVAWANAPKFQPGQEGVFILRKTTPEKGASKSQLKAAKDDPAQTYTALHAHDFQPTHKAERIKTLIRAVAPKTPAKATPAKKRR